MDSQAALRDLAIPSINRVFDKGVSSDGCLAVTLFLISNPGYRRAPTEPFDLIGNFEYFFEWLRLVS